MTDLVRLSLAEALALCAGAARGAGASADCAQSIARAAVDAEAEGQPTVGLSHFADYLNALREGRIDGQAEPAITHPRPTMIAVDAKGGSAHLGFDRSFDKLVGAARTFGVAIFAQHNAYTAGALGWFVGRLADAGLVAFAATNGPPLMTGSGTTRAVFCTNPMAFAAPRRGAPPLLIDQASSATAFVNVRAAADRGETLPEGWALGPDGQPTTDPHLAMGGALLPFGGARGANVALMVEVLAAGLAGGLWSIDAGSITSGDRTPGSGLFVIAIDPAPLAGPFAERLGDHLERLSGDFGLHVPGQARARAKSEADRTGLLISTELHRTISSFLPGS